MQDRGDLKFSALVFNKRIATWAFNPFPIQNANGRLIQKSDWPVQIGVTIYSDIKFDNDKNWCKTKLSILDYQHLTHALHKY